MDILATKFKVLLMLGTPFGAPGYLRLSYGSIPVDDAIAAVQRLKDGFEFIDQLSKSRSI